MKKILSLVLALTFCLCMASSAFAIDQNAPLTVDGYVGLSATAGTTLIDVTLPSGSAMTWAADETSVVSGVPQVYAATYGITNNSTLVDLNITLVSFTQDNVTTNTDAAAVAPNLTLNLTGNLAVSGVNFANNYTTGYAYPTMLYANNAGTAAGSNAWTFTFGGSYAASLPSTALLPEYDMVMNFAIN